MPQTFTLKDKPTSLRLGAQEHRTTMLSFPFLFLASAYAQSNALYSGSNTLPTTASSTTSIPNLGGDIIPTGTEASYQSLNSTRTLYTRSLSGEIENVATTMAVANASLISFPASPSPSSVTVLQGSDRPTPAVNGAPIANSTSSSTSTSEQPTNTQPCNNYPELCNRKYGDITQVAAHNSPFSVPHNAASNQALGLVHQLNDGIRMLQGQTHLVNGTMYYCHTSCDILNAGTAESYFTDVARWVERHPYDVSCFSGSHLLLAFLDTGLARQNQCFSILSFCGLL